MKVRISIFFNKIFKKRQNIYLQKYNIIIKALYNIKIIIIRYKVVTILLNSIIFFFYVFVINIILM